MFYMISGFLFPYVLLKHACLPQSAVFSGSTALASSSGLLRCRRADAGGYAIIQSGLLATIFSLPGLRKLGRGIERPRSLVKTGRWFMGVHGRGIHRRDVFCHPRWLGRGLGQFMLVTRAWTLAWNLSFLPDRALYRGASFSASAADLGPPLAAGYSHRYGFPPGQILDLSVLSHSKNWRCLIGGRIFAPAIGLDRSARWSQKNADRNVAGLCRALCVAAATLYFYGRCRNPLGRWVFWHCFLSRCRFCSSSQSRNKFDKLIGDFPIHFI